MAKFISLSTIVKSANVVHLDTDYYTIDAGGYRGVSGWLVFQLKSGEVITRRAYFDCTCGQAAFYWVRIKGVKYSVGYPLDVTKFTPSNWQNADQAAFFNAAQV